MQIPEEFIIPWKIRISPQARALLSELKDDISLRDLAHWVMNDSPYGVIGDGHVLSFLQERNKK